MSNYEEKTIPDLRFPEFKEKWKAAKSKEFFSSSRAKGELGLPVYSVTQNHGLVLRDSLDRQIGVDAGAEKNLRASENDLVYNMMRMWQGAVGIAVEECMVSPAYVVLCPHKEVDSSFFLYMFNRAHSLYLLWSYSYGLTNDRLRLYYKDFSQIKFYAPDLPEQEKNASFLSSVDKKIKQLERKRTLLEQYKTGIMQQIFSQTTRFKDDNGNDFPNWEEKRLGTMCDLISGLTYTPSDVADNGLLVLRSSNVQNGRIAYEDNVYVKLQVEPASMAKPGDILLCVRNGSKSLIGKNALIPENVTDATHGAFMLILRSQMSRFIFQLLQTDTYKRQVFVNLGATINSINSNALKKFIFRIPKSEEERTKIVDFLSVIDSKVDAVDSQISQMQAFKKSLLQQLFV